MTKGGIYSAVQSRRSIRKFKDEPIDPAAIRRILHAGTLAPSSKNRQPWSFVVASGRAKDEMLSVFRCGLDRERRSPLLVNSAEHLRGAEKSLEIMRSAPVTVFIINTLAQSLFSPLSAEERIYEICNVQSIGAAIENMALAAQEEGLGCLWVCDVFFAYRELSDWLGTDGLIAALAVGYADERPLPRPRKSVEQTTKCRT